MLLFNTMAPSIKQMTSIIALLGVKAFLFGIFAELRKPDGGKPSISNGVLTCKYPSDPSVYLGFLSIVAFTTSAVIGFYSIFYPYNKKSVPYRALFRTTTMFVYFQLAVWVSLLAEAMLLWATMTELIHLTNNVHHNLNAKCSTAKTGLFGGAAFMALNGCLFWLLSLMLANNARQDYFGDEDDDEKLKGDYGQVFVVDNEVKEQPSAA